MKDQTIFQLYTDDNKSKYSSNPDNILKSEKCYYLICLQNSDEHFNLCEDEVSLGEIIKSVNSETNNKPPGNDSLKAEFYRHFSSELASVLLGVYDSRGKLETMGVTYRTEIISAIRAVSRKNYFRKTSGYPKWEALK